MPLLQVANLTVEFPTRRGLLRALDDLSFTGAAIIGLLEPPGRVAHGEITLDGRRIDNLPPEQMRRIRGRRIGAIFQDPLTTLNPLYSIGRQLVETMQTHLKISGAEAHRRAVRWLTDVGIPGAACQRSEVVRDRSSVAL